MASSKVKEVNNVQGKNFLINTITE